MARKRHKQLDDTEIAKLLMKAQKYRRRFVSNTDPFNVITHIERELSFNEEFTFDIVGDLKTDGVPNDARVIFSGGVLLEIGEQTYVGAIKGNGTDRYTLAHEIAHIFLHREKFSTKTKLLARGRSHSGTSFRSNPREEWEANCFAAGLVIPYSMVLLPGNNFSGTTKRELVLRYKVSTEIAARMISDVRRVRYIIDELSGGKYN